MTLDLDLGVDLTITDDPSPAVAPTATDTGFLIHSLAASASPTTKREIPNKAAARALYPNEPALLAHTDAFFEVGGGRLFVVPLEDEIEDALALISPQDGPGQISAPEIIATVDQTPVTTFAWNTNRIYIADGPDGANEAAMITLSNAQQSSAGRNAGIWGDTLLIPGIAPGTTREVRSSIVTAALMGRSDLATGNPNLAAAGNHTPGAGGQPGYVVGIKHERPFGEIKRLAREQVNSYRTVNGRVRNYGMWTLADLDVLPHWWDLSGSRTMMAIRAEEQAVAEEMMFGQVAADGLFLDKYNGSLSGVLARYQRLGALFGKDTDKGYSVRVDATVNPTSQVAIGKIKAQILCRTSPFAAELELTITRRAITDSVE